MDFSETASAPKLQWITIWLFNIAMERSTHFLIGKPSISMGHLYHGYVSHNQRVSQSLAGNRSSSWCAHGEQSKASKVKISFKGHQMATNSIL